MIFHFHSPIIVVNFKLRLYLIFLLPPFCSYFYFIFSSFFSFLLRVFLINSHYRYFQYQIPIFSQVTAKLSQVVVLLCHRLILNSDLSRLNHLITNQQVFIITQINLNFIKCYFFKQQLLFHVKDCKLLILPFIIFSVSFFIFCLILLYSYYLQINHHSHHHRRFLLHFYYHFLYYLPFYSPFYLFVPLTVIPSLFFPL